MTECTATPDDGETYPEPGERWIDFCQRTADALPKQEDFYSDPTKKSRFHSESFKLLPYLASMNRLGFMTCSSQPTQDGMSTLQRASISGYMPQEMSDFLYAKLPRDLVIWENRRKSEMAVSADLNTGVHRGNTWSGEMMFDKEKAAPFGPNFVAFHVTDMDWDREDFYLFEHVVDALKEFVETEPLALATVAGPAIKRPKTESDAQ